MNVGSCEKLATALDLQRKSALTPFHLCRHSALTSKRQGGTRDRGSVEESNDLFRTGFAPRDSAQGRTHESFVVGDRQRRGSLVVTRGSGRPRRLRGPCRGADDVLRGAAQGPQGPWQAMSSSSRGQ